MKRFGFTASVSAVLLTTVAAAGGADGRFRRTLPADKQIVHVLNRLTFGPRPGDLEQVRHMGIAKWIALQLHPDRIVENPVLEQKLRPLGTLRLATWQILEKYPAVPAALTAKLPSAVAFSSLPQQQSSRLMNGSVEERRATLASFDADTRRRVLAGAPLQVLEVRPEEVQQEAAAARQG